MITDKYVEEKRQGFRYLVLDKDGIILYRYPPGSRFQWDFTLPGPAKGGQVIDLND